MHLQTLLPAILFAQTSFAGNSPYYCCVQYETSVHAKGFARYFLNGGTENWKPQLNRACQIELTKTGEDCGKWTVTASKGNLAAIALRRDRKLNATHN
ncbi:hypothetical protein EG327_003374 [Venturia inaequalis]|uniref:DUF4189 domain-containing protein n=1 Tax=Venturia inaequalis TaxID=5025 RepID=A0A8H3U211_VENIN|nr:hypothetical protein EG327_003374 [Venturia inaequalis]